MNCSEIKHDIKKILDYRCSPPNTISSNQSLQNDLGGKKFSELPDEKQRMIYGDVTILNEKAFHYYLFEIIENAMDRNELPPLFDMFLLSLSKRSMSFDNRLNLLSKQEKQIVVKFLKCALKYITTSNNEDAINLLEDYMEDVKDIIDFWEAVV